MTWHHLPSGHGASGSSALTLAAVVTLAALAACGEGGPAGPEEEPEERLENQAPPGLSVSDPLAGEEYVAYVSASPGSFPGGESVTVTNLANGASVGASLLDGGFDPIAIAAEPDHELEIVVRFADGTTASFLIRLPMRRPPRVVRTRPPKGETDVVLNVTATVVFSEPVDSSTVNDRTVQLRLDGEPVEGILTVSEDGLQAEFTPADPLQPGSRYILVVTRDVLDLSGDRLEEELQVSFTTVPPSDLLQIAFESDRLGPTEVYMINADGSGLVNLSRRPGRADRGPVWSPDGSKFAFESMRDDNWEIYVMRADRTGLVNVTESPDWELTPTWSPDGSKIAFVSSWRRSMVADDVDIYIENLDTGGRTKLAAPGDAYAPAWSPDGSKVAFVSRETETSGWHWDIYVINWNGVKDLVNLTASLGEEHQMWPKWSPDGSKIAFLSNPLVNYEGDIYVMNADGSGVVNLTNAPDSRPAHHVWSPDGSKIAFTAYDSEVYVVNADGTGLVNLTRSPGIRDRRPAWSPDGSKIAFTSASDRDGNLEIYIMNADGTGQVNLTNSPGGDFNPAWRPRR